MSTKYFDKPTQVVFRDPDNEEGFIGGIAYRDEIICGCCGGIFELNEVEDLLSIDWIDISDSIRGDMSAEKIEKLIEFRRSNNGKVH